MKAEEGVGGHADDNVRLCKKHGRLSTLLAPWTDSLLSLVSPKQEQILEARLQTASHLCERRSHRRVGVGSLAVTPAGERRINM